MNAIRAVVHNGRIHTDEPLKLPDGTDLLISLPNGSAGTADDHEALLAALTRGWLASSQGWTTSRATPEFPLADLVARYHGDLWVDGETWLITAASGDHPWDTVCDALGRLVVMMDRDFRVNAFGLPQPDPACEPPLVRYALAVPEDERFRNALRAIPERIRRMLHLVLLVVADDAVIKYLPAVKV